MKLAELDFERPAELAATRPAEFRGRQRGEGRLMVTTRAAHEHHRFYELPDILGSGDLLVVNRSATLPASLPASNDVVGTFTLNLSTHYGKNLWLAEPRWTYSEPGPLPFSGGEQITVSGIAGKMLSTFPGLSRLWFVQFEDALEAVMASCGMPIRYGYLDDRYPLTSYQTIFADCPGSAEMPSAGYPFTQELAEQLLARGVGIAKITLHTGVSSLEVEAEDVEEHPLYPEPFVVPQATASAIRRTKERGGRVIAVGTTVVRALESAWDGENVRAISGFTRRYVHPRQGVHVIDALLTGMHDPMTSHLAMLYSIADQEQIRGAYEEAIRAGYLWHEFGDSHLIFCTS